MKTEYYITNPAGNKTALVTSYIDKSHYKKVSSLIMGMHSDIEQVGFLDLCKDVITLNMSGGEFCGNATLSAAGLYSHLSQTEGDFTVNVSGTEKPLTVHCKKGEKGYLCECVMPYPKKTVSTTLAYKDRTFELPIVEMEGISHIIAPFDFDKKAAEYIIKDYAEKNRISALGFMFYNSDSSCLTPLVYVAKTDTLFYENSCASGSCAVCAYRSYSTNGEVSLSIKQPGGIIKVSANVNKGFVRLCNNIIIENRFEKELSL